MRELGSGNVISRVFMGGNRKAPGYYEWRGLRRQLGVIRPYRPSMGTHGRCANKNPSLATNKPVSYCSYYGSYYSS